MTHKLSKCGLIAVAGLLTAALPLRAPVAMPSCDGTYAAEAPRPLPAKMVVDVDIRDPSPDHLRLAERFRSGLRAAGITVGPRPNVLLSITSRRLDSGPEQSLGGTTPPSPQFPDLQGAGELDLPVIPEARIARPEPPPSPPLLLIRVEAKESQAVRGAWVANVQCEMVGTDDGALAEDLGRVIGQSLGKRVERGPL